MSYGLGIDWEEHWPNVHPDDPDLEHDDWRPGRCERCSKPPLGAAPVLVRWVHCDASDCTGCISLCLEHMREEFP